MISKTGASCDVEQTVTPIRWRDGRAVGGVVVLRDITRRRRLESELKQADRRKDEFLAMLAHEFRNPLAPISAAASLLSKGLPDAAAVQKTSAVIARQVRHMTSLIDDLLDVSRVTRGLVVLSKAPLAFKAVISEAVEQVRPTIDLRAHALTVHLAPEPLTVCGDKKRLVQVVANLLGNAAKYTPNQGRIVLNVELRGDDIVLTVSDNGIGMSKEFVGRAFHMFAQAERGG